MILIDLNIVLCYSICLKGGIMPELPLRKRSSNNSYKLSEFIGKDKA